MNLDEERNEETDQPNEDVEMADKVGDREADELKPSINGCSERKLFVGRISTKTTEESFKEYFSKFGQVADSVLMRDKDSGRRRGIGFVIYADPEIADKVLKEDHTIDGKKVDVKKSVTNTTRIYVGGLPLSLTEDELKEHFSPYGYVVDHCIVLDRRTGRSRRFGYVSFDKEEAVEKVLSDGHKHELCGKQVEINRAAPKRAGAAGYRSSSYGVHAYNGRGRGYGNSGSGWNDGGNGGYGGGGTNDAHAYGNASAANGRSVPAYNGRGRGYGNNGNSWNYGGNGGYGGGGINDTYAYGNTGSANERYVPVYNGRGRGYGNSGNNWNYRGNGGYGGGNGGYGGGGTNGAYAYGNTGAANERCVPAYNGHGRGYGNSGNNWNYGGNGGYGGGGINDAYAYGNTGAANERYVPAYNGRGRGYGNSGNNWNYWGNGGYGGGGTNDAYAYGNTGAAMKVMCLPTMVVVVVMGTVVTAGMMGGTEDMEVVGTNGAYAYENTGAANRRSETFIVKGEAKPSNTASWFSLALTSSSPLSHGRTHHSTGSLAPLYTHIST
ncbi:hypothetical protein KY284_027642 [Solanum tuberosum]|nr:hypothetical protein KY284_027642 [Solanum tuberosum]